mgnify:CR=1 FL=1
MTQFKDIHGNCWAFVRANISLIFYTPKDQKGISHVRVTTTDNMVYFFNIDLNDADAIRES